MMSHRDFSTVFMEIPSGSGVGEGQMCCLESHCLGVNIEAYWWGKADTVDQHKVSLSAGTSSVGFRVIFRLGGGDILS